jgi:isopenicillin N synthase-like dioxygenase
MSPRDVRSPDVMTGNVVPTLDIRRFTDPTGQPDRNAFIVELGAAYREWGFAGIRGHGIPPSLIESAYDASVRFFALPDETRMRYLVPGQGGARGYTPFGIETAKGGHYPDLKEFWHIGRELGGESRYAETMPQNLWPEEVRGFRTYCLALYDALDALGRSVLSALAIHIGLPAAWFDDKVDHGNSILRLIHYPPIATPVDAIASASGAGSTVEGPPSVRAAAHEDINLITLLVGASAAGLEVESRRGEWVPFTSEGDTIVVNIGDMLQRLTNHVYPSTTHRVVNPPGEAARRPRYSMPFFLHPNPDFLIRTLPQCVSPENPDRYPSPITANDYLLQRLREIKLI